MLWPRNIFPGTNLNDINLDWILKKIKALRGGTTGQYLYKKSDLDFDFGWKTGSGGGGTSNYLDLDNKPSINNIELSGNKTAAELGLATPSDIPQVPVQSVNGKTGAVEITALDLGAYVKPVLGIPKTDLSDEVQASLNKADSALQAVPSTYRTASAQDVIDAAQDAKIGTFGHRNLLDNWYFGNPVNQRGQTIWQNAGEYTVDRWKLTSGTASLSASGLTLNGTLVQIRETTIGIPVMCSALLSDGSMITPTYDDSSKTYTITATGETIKAVKLELGSYQTLAHNEGTEANPIWVLNEIPNFVEELRKCQRYLYDPFKALKPGFPATWQGQFLATSSVGLAVGLPLPSMARIPTITFGDTTDIRDNGDGTILHPDVTNIAAQITTDYFSSWYNFPADTFTVGHVYGAAIYFNAEL